MTSAANAKSGIGCGACGGMNGSDSQFCTGCGKSLWETCVGCSAQAIIGQRFCNKCGFDLQAETAKRLASRLETLQRAREIADEGNLEQAIRVAVKIADAPDHRYVEVAKQADEFVERTKKELAGWGERVQELPVLVQPLVDARKFKDVVALLGPVPQKLLPTELVSILDDCRSKATSASQSKEALKLAIANKDWNVAIEELAHLLELFPGKQKYLELVTAVSQKIAKAAAKLTSEGRYADALVALDSIPPNYQSDSQRKQRSELEELVFLRKIVAASPFAIPMVGAAIQNLKKLTPDDAKLEKLEARFENRRRTRPAKGHYLYADWMEVKSGVFPGSIVPTGLPSNLAGSRPACLAKRGATYWVALGLAMQGLGMGAEDGSFLKSGKSGMLGMLGRKKPAKQEAAWGIEIGDSSIKAIKLSLKEEGLRIEDAVLAPIESERIAEGGLRRPSAANLFRALEKLFSDPVFGQTPVVTNLPGCDLLTRYLDLPLQNVKQHRSFIDQETQANIPISFDLLETTHCKFEPATESSVSQKAMILALRKSDVESRVSMLKRLDVNLIGLTPEPIAYVNAMNGMDHLGALTSDVENATQLILDVGHVSTTVMLLSRSAGWFRRIDWGLEDLTLAIAREFKLGYSEADSLRKSPTQGTTCHGVIAAMQSSCTTAKRELERSLRAAKEVLGAHKLVAASLMGGGAYQPLLGSMLNDESI